MMSSLPAPSRPRRPSHEPEILLSPRIPDTLAYVGSEANRQDRVLSLNRDRDGRGDDSRCDPFPEWDWR